MQEVEVHGWLLSGIEELTIEVMHRAWSTPTRITVSHVEWQNKNAAYTQVHDSKTKLAQFIDALMQ